MYKNSQKKHIDVSTARRDFSKILDDVFINDSQYVITKHGLPVALLSRESPDGLLLEDRKHIDLQLFGTLKEAKKSSVEIAGALRKKSWKRKK